MAPKLPRRAAPARAGALTGRLAAGRRGAFAFAVFVVVELLDRRRRQRSLPPGAVPVPQQLVPGVPKGSQGARSEKAYDPLAFDAADTADLERRAAAGYAQPLYTVTDGGAVAGAQRTARWRGRSSGRRQGSGFDPDVVEAIVFLESSGRPEVIAGGDLRPTRRGSPRSSPSTGQDMLGMRVDLASEPLADPAHLQARRARPQRRAADRLRARRRRVDERFDPGKALAATVRYLTAARARFGRDDLAVVVLPHGLRQPGARDPRLRGRRDDAGARDRRARQAQLREAVLRLLAAAPRRHLPRSSNGSATTRSPTTGASSRREEIMRLLRTDPERLQTLQDLHDNKGSSEEVLHPADSTQRFAQPGDVQKAIDDGDLEAAAAGGHAQARLRRRPARWASRPGAWAASRRSTARCAPRRSRCSSTWAPACGRSTPERGPCG